MVTVLRIEGMRCAGCAKSIERALTRIEGVSSVRVNYETGATVIDHEVGVNQEALAAFVVDIGFSAQRAAP